MFVFTFDTQTAGISKNKTLSSSFSSSQQQRKVIYAHRVILFKHRFFKNLFNVHETLSSHPQQEDQFFHNEFHFENLTNMDQNLNIDPNLLKVPIQEPFQLFSSLIEYFYTGIIKCEVNDLSEMIMMAYRFKIIPLISLLKKQLMGEMVTLTTSIGGLDSNSLSSLIFDKNSILQLPEGTKMTLENALSLFNEVAGSYAVLEHSVFKSEMHLAKRVILKSVCFGLLFQESHTQRLLKFSVNALQSLLELLTQHVRVMKEIQELLVSMNVMTSSSLFTTRELVKFILKWLCHLKHERLFSISQLYPTLRAFEESMGAEASPKIGGGTQVEEFIKSIEMMQTTRANGNHKKKSTPSNVTVVNNNTNEEDDSEKQQQLLRKRGVSTLSKIGSFSLQHKNHQRPAEMATAPPPPSKKELTSPRDGHGSGGGIDSEKTLKRTTTFTSPRQLQRKE